MTTSSKGLQEKPFMTTVSGINFEFLDPKSHQIDITDIAHALSMCCRFSGQVKQFYSIAEHCVRVSHICDPEDALWGLLHDASEAYISDVPSPVKKCLRDYRTIEDFVQLQIAEAFGLAPLMPDSVHDADMRMLATEARDLCHPRISGDCLTFLFLK